MSSASPRSELRRRTTPLYPGMLFATALGLPFRFTVSAVTAQPYAFVLPLLGIVALFALYMFQRAKRQKQRRKLRKRTRNARTMSRFSGQSVRRLLLALSISALLLCALLLIVQRVSAADIPLTHAYSGRLTTSGGSPVTTSTSIRLSYWSNVDKATGDVGGDGAIYTGAATYLAWQETHTVTPDSDGYFMLDMGSITSLPTYATLPAGITLSLQVEVKAAAAADTAYELLDPQPDNDAVDRTAVLAVPYATMAETLQRRSIGTGSGSIPLLGSGGLLPGSMLPGGTDSDAFTINADDSATGSVVLHFGSTLGKTLEYSVGSGRFEFNDSVHVAGDLTVTGSINGVTLSAISATPLAVADAGGLTVSVASGSYRINGTIAAFAGSGSVTLADDATNYLFFTADGLQVNITGFPANQSFIPLAELTTAGGDVTGVTDSRVLQGDDREQTVTRVLHPAFEGASVQGDGADNIGQLSLSSDNLSLKNFYLWTSTRPTLQDYDILVQFTLPPSFVRWEESLTLAYRSTSASTDDNKADVQVYDSNGVPVTLSGSALNLAGTGWQSTHIEFTGNPTWTPGENMLIRLKLSARENYQMQIGDLTLDYRDLAP